MWRFTCMVSHRLDSHRCQSSDKQFDCTIDHVGFGCWPFNSWALTNCSCSCDYYESALLKMGCSKTPLGHYALLVIKKDLAIGPARSTVIPWHPLYIWKLIFHAWRRWAPTLQPLHRHTRLPWWNNDAYEVRPNGLPYANQIPSPVCGVQL